MDVNKEARKPSEARLILLSDSELLNIFTRCLLNRLRESNPPFPLYAIEYDNPNDDSNRPVRWSAMADLGLLKRAIQFTAFCPPKYRKNMQQTFGGRLSESEMDSRMREALDLGTVLPSIIEADNIERDSIGNTLFPESQIDTLRCQFMRGWGTVILEVLGDLLPYQSHAAALKQLDQNWLTDDAISSLARDAIYVGVGMYWTLRDSETYHKKQEERLRAEHLPLPPKPDIVKAWDIIEKKSQDFEALRSNIYSGKTSPDYIKDSNRAFDIMNTHACQLGVFLTLTSLADAIDAKMEDISRLAGQVIKAWNSSLSFNINQSRKRLFFFDRQQSSSINRIPRLDPSLSVYFRYFWLELLCTPEGFSCLSIEGIKEVVLTLRSSARRGYLDFLIREQIKSLKRSNPSWSDRRISQQAEEIETRELRKALKFWAIEEYDAFDHWLKSADKVATIPFDDDNNENAVINQVQILEEENLDSVASIDNLLDSIDVDD